MDATLPAVLGIVAEVDALVTALGPVHVLVPAHALAVASGGVVLGVADHHARVVAHVLGGGGGGGHSGEDGENGGEFHFGCCCGVLVIVCLWIVEDDVTDGEDS
jgi:hypothetical protein